MAVYSTRGTHINDHGPDRISLLRDLSPHQRRKHMRRLVLAMIAAMALTGASTLLPSRADAMSLNGSALAATAHQTAGVEQVRLVCRNVWNGWRWVRRCYRTRPVIVYPRHRRYHHRY